MKRIVQRFLGRKPSSRHPDAPALPFQIEEIRQGALKGQHLQIVQWGQVLLDSVYVPRNPVAALDWFTIAANAGFGPGHNMRGRCFQFGWGCEKDLLQAARCYEAAAKAGDEWGRYNLGIMTMRGIGMEANLARALDLFRTAANNGHAKSMNLYARFLEEGWVVPQDRVAALDWYRRSAEGGDYRGQHNHATALVDAGKINEALGWWRQAAVDATSDILLAMDQKLTALGPTGDAELLEQVRGRLTEMGISPSGAAGPISMSPKD
ncbi:tetratricopeptide repeat protein [Gluconobacter roseus]|uniref:tetratricopeptide repeat protein n=1 Tax=Gluconobacter roseus TaxID=586239 RepID=UPI0038D24D5B